MSTVPVVDQHRVADISVWIDRSLCHHGNVDESRLTLLSARYFHDDTTVTAIVLAWSFRIA
jgi:hypothetical protein